MTDVVLNVVLDTKAVEGKIQNIGRRMRDTLGGISDAGEGLAKMIGLDNKEFAQLYKTFEKIGGAEKMVKGLTDLGATAANIIPKIKEIGPAFSTAFAANPVLLIVSAIAVLGAAIAAIVIAYQDVYDAEGEWYTRATKNITSLKSETEKYINLLNNHATKIRDWNERDLTEGEKAKKRFIEQTEAQKGIIKNTIIQLELKEKMIAASLEEARAGAEIWRWTDPQKYALAQKGIADLEKRHQNVVVAIRNGTDAYKKFTSESAAAAEKIQKEVDYIDKHSEATKNNTKSKEDNVKIAKMQWTIVKDQLEEQKNFLKQIFPKKNLQGGDVSASLLSQFLYGDDPEKVIKDFNTYIDEGINALARTRQKIESEQPKGADGQPKGWFWYTLTGPAPQQAKAEAIQIASDTADATGSIFQSIGDVIGEETRSGAIAARTGALFQIGASTATAIAKAVEAGAANPLNAFSFGAAGIATFAAMLAQIFAGMSQAKAVLSQPLPKFNQGGYFVGGHGNVDNVNAVLTPGEYVFNTGTVNKIGKDNLEQMNKNGRVDNQPIRVYVTEKDITDTQNKVNVIKNRTSI